MLPRPPAGYDSQTDPPIPEPHIPKMFSSDATSTVTVVRNCNRSRNTSVFHLARSASARDCWLKVESSSFCSETSHCAKILFWGTCNRYCRRKIWKIAKHVRSNLEQNDRARNGRQRFAACLSRLQTSHYLETFF